MAKPQSVAEAASQDSAESPGIAVPEITPRLFQAYLATRVVLDKAVRSEGTTLSQFGLMLKLYVEPGLSIATVARHLGVASQSAQGLIAALEKAGFVSKTPAGAGRPISLYLTAAGRDLCARCAPVVTEAEERILDCLPETDRVRLVKILDRLIQAANTAPR